RPRRRAISRRIILSPFSTTTAPLITCRRRRPPGRRQKKGHGMELRLSIADLNRMHSALLAFDGGYAKVVKTNAGEKMERVPYHFDPDTLYALANNIAALAPKRAAYERAHNALVAQLSGGKRQVPDDR